MADFIGWVLRAYRYTRCFDASIAASADSVAPERLTGLVTMGGGAHLPKVETLYPIGRDRMIYSSSYTVDRWVYHARYNSTQFRHAGSLSIVVVD